MNEQELDQWPFEADAKGVKLIESGEYEGIRWALVGMTIPGYTSYVNGYVLIPDDHPWADLDYDNLPVEVHGGLTYGAFKTPGVEFAGVKLPPRERTREETLGWVGFDTAHAFDHWPQQELVELGLDPYPSIPGFDGLDLIKLVHGRAEVWTYELVLKEVIDLARQVREAQ